MIVAAPDMENTRHEIIEELTKSIDASERERLLFSPWRKDRRTGVAAGFETQQAPVLRVDIEEQAISDE